MSHAEEKPILLKNPRMPFWSRILCRWVNGISVGQLTIRFPDGGSYHVKGSIPGPSAILNVNSGKLIWKLMIGGDLGLARAYIDGDWDTPDLGSLLELGLVNEAALSAMLSAPGPARLLAFLRHRFRANTRKGSKQNIAFHYDLGNEFYAHWLDETMTYSSAIFSHPDQSLEDAQRAKYARIVEELKLGQNDHVLEVGCGWGGFAEFAVREVGCQITCLTLSSEQARFAKERLAKAGLSDKVEVRLQDYRDCTGKFDKVVSIEMFEAVGEENWPTYFNALRGFLKPGGGAMIQVITISDEQFSKYRENADFIQTYIFPGGMLPSEESFTSAATAAGLTLRNKVFFGACYERTLLDWDKAFTAAWPRIEPLGFDERFKRMWRYYLHYCAVGFRSQRINVAQFHLERG